LIIKYVDPTTDERWDRFITGQVRSTVFHTSAWARVIKDTYGYEPHYYTLENDDGQITAAIPFYLIRSRLTGKRLVSLPFSDYCWPLGEAAVDIATLAEAAKQEVTTGAASFLEVRGWQNGTDPAPLNLVPREYHVTYILDVTPSLETLTRIFHDNVRRGIKQAEKRGIKAYISTGEDGIEKFYALNVMTRKKLGVLPQPHAFFRNIYRHLISQHLGFTALAESEGQTVAGVVFLIHKDTLYYKFNASDPAYLQKRPNHVATWEGLKHGRENGLKRLDFGRCTPEEEGLRVYKARWGAKEVNLPYYYYPEVKGITSASETSLPYRMMRIFSGIVPRPVFEAAGSILYRHLG
jgi:lipid II:glycine glycyltransferase (peptidoglycan interpeptide bridge formation enzyme)